ncbi:MAG: MFS transporter, partial [Kiloniellales bacterium]|nr:MFS transporter [Kiloniellales bacterium]
AFAEYGLVMLLGRALEGLGFAVAAIVGPVIANAAASKRALPIIAGLVAAWIPVGQLAASFAAPLFLASSGWKGLWWFATLSCLLFMGWAALFHRRQPEVFQIESHQNKTPAVGERLIAPQKLAIVATAATFMFWSAQYFAYMTWLPQYLVEQFGLAVQDATLGYIIPVVLVMISCVAGGGLLRLGLSLPWLLLSALAVQSLVWWTLPLIESEEVGLVSLAVYGASAGLVPACLFATPSTVMGSGRKTGTAFGIVMTGRNLGVFTGPLLLAWAFSMLGAWDLASPIFGAVTTCCLPFAALLLIALSRLRQQGITAA